jgi:benzoylsuccinyl-CoA thiolase BbsB subunit
VEAAYIAGAACVPFVRTSAFDIAEMGARAGLAAIADAGLGPDEIDAVFCGTVHGGAGLGQRIALQLGRGGIAVLNLENACATSSVAVHEAALWVAVGKARAVLVVGAEQMSTRAGLPVVDAPSSYDYIAHGVSWPVHYALHAHAQIVAGRYSEEDLALVAVKNRRHAADNPCAQFRDPITVSDVLASRLVSSPLRLLMCSPRSDGAAAVVVADAATAARNGRPPVRLAASELASGQLLDGARSPERTVTEIVARRAYEAAGIGPEDVDVVELHDAFASAELDHYLSLGLCDDEPGALVRSGATSLGGAGPIVNPGGGLMSRGHPVGATGAAQVGEIARQLWGCAGRRQVPGAAVGLTHTMGGTVFELESNVCAVHVLVR